MSPLAAVRDGIRRVNSAPAVLAGVWFLTLVVSLPLTLALRGMLQQHLGGSLAAETAADGANFDWMQEFGDQASGLGVTFKPTIIGFGAVLDNLSAFIDNDRRPIVIVGAASAYLFLWMFVAGGIIDRYARNRETHASGFFSASGVFFFRFLRLGIVMWIVYALVFGTFHRWLFADVYPQATRELSVERTAFLVRLSLYVLFGIVLAVCNLIFDYAKVRAVVEDRRSMLGAIGAALRFIQRNDRAVMLVYLIDAALFVAVVGVYAAIAPGAGSTGWTMWIAFIVGQLYVVARLWTKLVFWASETALFQSRLAHASYVAAPEPTWPESPTIEAIMR